MAHRLRALFMLLIVGLVLPLAGSVRVLCLHDGMAVSDSGCCSGEANCCDCSDDLSPTDDPCCVVAPEPIPEAVASIYPAYQAPMALPAPPLGAPPAFEEHREMDVIARPRDRGPPGPLPLYLLTRSLLL